MWRMHTRTIQQIFPYTLSHAPSWQSTWTTEPKKNPNCVFSFHFVLTFHKGMLSIYCHEFCKVYHRWSIPTMGEALLYYLQGPPGPRKSLPGHQLLASKKRPQLKTLKFSGYLRTARIRNDFPALCESPLPFLKSTIQPEKSLHDRINSVCSEMVENCRGPQSQVQKVVS